MDIDKRRMEKLMSTPKFSIKSHRILDRDKFIYWYTKSDEYTDKLASCDTGSKEFIENLRQGLICQMEQNKYCIITRRDFMMLFALMKYHNSINSKDKLWMDSKGRRVKR